MGFAARTLEWRVLCLPAWLLGDEAAATYSLATVWLLVAKVQCASTLPSNIDQATGPALLFACDALCPGDNYGESSIAYTLHSTPGLQSRPSTPGWAAESSSSLDRLHWTPHEIILTTGPDSPGSSNATTSNVAQPVTTCLSLSRLGRW